MTQLLQQNPWAATALVALLAAVAALAASWDGKWVFETKNKKQDAGVQTTLVLKTEGDAVKGIVTTGGKRRDRTADIKDG